MFNSVTAALYCRLSAAEERGSREREERERGRGRGRGEREECKM